MAGKRPFFLTGANAKIRVNGRTLAYCSDLSYSVVVNHVAPQVLGMYEGSSIEPLSYSVSGSFTVIRYIADVASSNTGGKPNGVQNAGNGIGNWGTNDISFNNLSDGRAYENLKPSKLHTATSFDIDVFQKVSNAVISQTTGGVAPPVPEVTTNTYINTQVAVAKIRNVRITKADFSISKKAPALQTFNFTALYVDEDSFLADFSGNGQQFA